MEFFQMPSIILNSKEKPNPNFIPPATKKKEKICMIKIWVDDVRDVPAGYDIALKSTTDVIHYLKGYKPSTNIFLNLDHDAGDYAKLGGDYYKILDWCEAHGYNPVVHFHSMNPAGVEKMRQIAQHNHWEEI